MTYRSRKHLDLAHDMQCKASFPHDCNGYQGCEPAHADWSVFGRGKDFKSPDWAIAAVCHNAHRELDSRAATMSKDLRNMEWLRAFVATQNELYEQCKLGVI